MPQEKSITSKCVYRHKIGPKKGQICNGQIKSIRTHPYCEECYDKPDIVSYRTLYSAL